MAVHQYVVPKLGTGLSMDDVWRPKYFTDNNGRSAGHGVGHSQQNQFAPYGLNDSFLVTSDVTVGEDIHLKQQPDVVAMADNPATALGADLPTLTAALEPLGFSTDGLTATHTYRDLWQRLQRLSVIGTRMHVVANQRLVPLGVSLDMPFASLSGVYHQGLGQVIASLGLTDRDLNPGLPIRTVLRLLADQLPAVPDVGL